MNSTSNSETSFQAPKQDPLGTPLAADTTKVLSDMNNTFSIEDESTFRQRIPLNSTFKISDQSTWEHQVGIDDSLGILSESQMRDFTIEADFHSNFLITRFFDDLNDIPEEETLEDSTVNSRPCKYKVSDTPKALTSKNVLHRMSSTPLDIQGTARQTFTTSPVNPTMDISLMRDSSDLNVTQELKSHVNIAIDQVKPKARTCLMDRLELDVLGKSSFKDDMPGISYLNDLTMLAEQSITFCDISVIKSITEEAPDSPDLDKTIPFILEADEPNQVEPKLDLCSTTLKVDVSIVNLPKHTKKQSEDINKNATAKLDKKINVEASYLPKQVMKSNKGFKNITSDSSGKCTKASTSSTFNSIKKLDQPRRSKSPTTSSKISKYAKPGVQKNVGRSVPKPLQQYSVGNSQNTAKVFQAKLRAPIENMGNTGGTNKFGKPTQKNPDSKWRSSACKGIVANKPASNKINEVNKDKNGQSGLQCHSSFVKRTLTRAITAAQSRASSNSRGPDSLVLESKISFRRDEYLSNRARSSSGGATLSAARSRSSSKGPSPLPLRTRTFTRSDAPTRSSSKGPSSCPSRSRTFTRSDAPSRSSSKGADSLVARASFGFRGVDSLAPRTSSGSRGADHRGAVASQGTTSVGLGRGKSVAGSNLTRSKPVARSVAAATRTTDPTTLNVPRFGPRRAASAVSGAVMAMASATTANAAQTTAAAPKSLSSRLTNQKLSAYK